MSVITTLGNPPVQPKLAVALPANPLVSGTIYQNLTGYWLKLDVPITATVAGTAQWALGPTSAPAAWAGATATIVGTVDKSIDVPPGWHYSLTVTGTATIGTASVLGH